MEKRNFIQNVKNRVKEHRLSVLYFLFAVCIEMVAVFTVEGSPFLTRPFISLGVLLAVTVGVMYIPSLRVRLFTYTGLLGIQAALDLVFAVIYDMTGQYFDFGMLSLRNDAFGILENLPVNFVAFYGGLFFALVYVVYGLRFSYQKKKQPAGKKAKWFYALAMVGGIAVTGISIVSYFPRNGVDKYDEMINGKAESAYSAYGMIGNLIGEATGAVFKDKSTLSDDDIERFIYQKTSTPTLRFGQAKGKNIITVLAESLEWYAFLAEGETFDEYPNALPFTAEDMEALYPNLREMYRESVVMSNFHSREKTDIAETISIMGSYPTGAYINYDYYENTLPHTLPALLSNLREEKVATTSFHNGFKSFYNRHKAHPALGFEGMVDMDDMEKIAKAWKEEGREDKIVFHDTMLDGLRNLDSEMVYTSRDIIVPKQGSEATVDDDAQKDALYLDYTAGESFYSYITTITMHGMYYSRDNLLQEQTRLEERLNRIYTSGDYKPVKGRENLPEPYCYMTKEGEILFYYMATALDTDKALGLLKEELKAKGLLEDTIIVLFGDHNAYYHALSDYTKDIDGYETERKFTDLYNVPLMLYGAGWSDTMTDEERIIDKFTCTADIVPTLLDLLGIKYYENLYYGYSVFSNEQSVLYSRAYDNFISDGIVSRSLNKSLYRGSMVTDEAYNAFKSEGARLVEKIKHCDYIFKQDYFAQNGNLKEFQDKMKAIN